MKKILVILVAFIGFGIVANAQTRITFYAFGPGFWGAVGSGAVGDKDTGHASFELEGYGMFGFGPNGSWYGKTGKVSDDGGYRSRATLTFTTTLTSAQASAVRRVADQWRSNPPIYNLGQNDCVSFVMRIADAAGLKYHHTTTQSPRAFVQTLQHNN